MLDDFALLNRFAATRAEDDFAELVRRHIDLVYSAALRQLRGDHQFAEEVTQNVFADLARKASALTKHGSLAGWLYTSAHFAAAKIIRGEQRRRLREQEVSQMQEIHANPTTDVEWEQLKPVIDDAMHELPETDRDIILQRYFERRPYVQIGGVLGLTENAARMRAERALDKLRGILAARGVSATALALGALLTAQTVLAAPVPLVNSVVSAGLLTAGAAGASAGIISLTSWKVLVPSACAVALLVGVVYQKHELGNLREALARQRQLTWNKPVASIPTEETDSRQAAAANLELLRLRGEVGRLNRELRQQEALATSLVEITNAIAEAQKTEPQINVKARFVTGDDGALALFKENTTSVINPAEFDKLLTHLKQSDQVDLLGEQQVTTLSARQAQVQSTTLQTNAATAVVTESRQIIDVLPILQGDGGRIELTLIASKYKDKPVFTNEVAALETAPLPIVEVSQMTAETLIQDGQTVALGMQSSGTKLVVFVTTTLIDASGNRVRPEGEP